MRATSKIYNQIETDRDAENVKSEISKNIGKNVSLKYLKQSPRFVGDFIGKIEGAYSNIFSVKVQRNGYEYSKSFSYMDIAVGLLQIEFDCAI